MNRCSSAACAILACAIPAAAQQGPETVIRTTTRLVEVRVAAYDAKGRPVSGLKREDFLVFDSGKQQPITLFAAESGVAGKPEAAGQAAAASAKRDDSAVILLDWINTSLPDRVRAFGALKKLLKTFQPAQKTAVYALASELRIVHQFTTDTDELLGAIEDTGFDSGNSDNLPPGSVAYPGTRIGAGAAEIQLMELDKRIRDGLDAFGALADRLAHMPGRKTLIWLSDGLPMMIDGPVVPGAHPAEYTYFAEIESILAKLNGADIAVYSVDAVGLPTAASKTVAHNLMFEVSQRTGGTVFFGRNDIDNGIRAALEDIDVSYTLGFAAPEDARPGLHAIQVRVNRSGLQLRYRESYALDGPAK